MNKVLNKHYIKLIIFQTISIFFFMGLISFLAVSVVRDFDYSDDFLKVMLMCWYILSFLTLCTCLYMFNVKKKGSDVIVNTATVVLTILYLSLAIDIGFVYYFNVQCIPYFLPVLLLYSLQNKSTANNTNVLAISIMIILMILGLKESHLTLLSSNVITLVIYLIGGMLLISALKENQTRLQIIGVTLIISIILFTANLITSLYVYNFVDALVKSLWTIAGGALSLAFYMGLLPFFESIFKITTDLKLSEYCNYNSKLLKRLADEAPGTFNHSIVVGNLAEACAAAIGENALLARVCAYYHDVGKLANPEYFAENQIDGYNPHDELIPEVSASMITKHTEKGYETIKKYGMPEEIAKVAREHHGTTLVQYFYNKAQNISESVLDKTNYMYQNPKPSTKIAAIIMICDTVEAATRANKGMDYEQMDALIKNLIKAKLDDNQFDHCNITIEELRVIGETIMKVIPGIYHHRVSYNNGKAK